MASGTPDYQSVIGKLKGTLAPLRKVFNPIIWPKNLTETQPAQNGADVSYLITAKGSINMIYMRYKVTNSTQDEETSVIRIETDGNRKLSKRIRTIFHYGDYSLNANSPIQLHKYDTSNKIYEFTLLIPFTFDSTFKLSLRMPITVGETYELDTMIVFNVEGSYTTSTTISPGIIGASDEGTEDASGTGETFDI